MERMCSHGIGHPDPDDLDFIRRTSGEEAARTLMIHACDGCCEDPRHRSRHPSLEEGWCADCNEVGDRVIGDYLCLGCRKVRLS